MCICCAAACNAHLLHIHHPSPIDCASSSILRGLARLGSIPTTIADTLTVPPPAHAGIIKNTRAVSACMHRFCKDCIEAWLRTQM